MTMSVQTTYSRNHDNAFAGMLADNGPHDIISVRNDEASAEMRFGVAVAMFSTNDDDGAKLLAATSDKVAGVVVHSHSYARDTDVGDTGVMPGKFTQVLRKGRIWVIAEEAITRGDRGFIRAVASGAELKGAFRKQADGSDCIDSTNQVVYLTSAGVGELVVAEVDFTGLAA